MSELSGECRAHGHLGAVHMALGNYTHALRCYQEQLEKAQELQDWGVEAQAFGNLGIAIDRTWAITKMQSVISNNNWQRLSTPTAQLDWGRAFVSIGDYYDALGDPEVTAFGNRPEAEECPRSGTSLQRLGQSQRALGNLQQALVCLEKRLVVAHELGSPKAKAAAYGELGQLHATLSTLEQAVSCLDHQQSIARELGDKITEADAVCGLGSVYQQMGEYATALRYHQNNLDIAEQLGFPAIQSRAYGNLGAVHEALGNYEQAVRYQEQHLSVAASTNDQLAKTLAYSSLGRVHQLLGNRTQAVAYLTQGLCIAEALGRRDEEARIRNRLGLALWSNGDLDGAQKQLEAATHLLESIRREARNSPDYKLSLFELQTSSYQVLQRVLVILNRQDEALVVAERGRTRAFVDLLLERQGHSENRVKSNGKGDEMGPNSLDQLKDVVNRQRASVLYYSLAAGFLYAWLIVPTKGIVRFDSTPLNDSPSENEPCENGDPIPTGSGLLERLVSSVRDNLGAELSTGGGGGGPVEDQYNTSEDGLSERTGFLRMVNRQYLLNSSNYSLSSLFSVGSVGGYVASLQGSTRSSASTQGSTRIQRRANMWQGPACLHALYTLLVAPFEDYLPVINKGSPCRDGSSKRELILILEGDLYLVPFPVLRASAEGAEYLCERFSLRAAPNLSSLRANRARKQENTDKTVRSLVVGTPKLPNAVTEHWGWRDIPQSAQEATMVAELLQMQALVGGQATKEQVQNKQQIVIVGLKSCRSIGTKSIETILHVGRGRRR